MEIKQFRYSRDNLSYLIYNHRNALAIDGGAVKQIMAFCRSKGLRLDFVANTHNHPDHTVGTDLLLAQSNAAYLTREQLLADGGIVLGEDRIAVLATPGHTADSVCFYFKGVLVTGDTLFNGTVGNCFSGDLKGFYLSIKALAAYPPETKVYAGHDYVNDSVAYARIMEPNNPHPKAFLDGYSPDHVVSTLADEVKINPFLRFNAPEMIALLKEKNLPAETEYDRWKSIMTMG